MVDGWAVPLGAAVLMFLGTTNLSYLTGNEGNFLIPQLALTVLAVAPFVKVTNFNPIYVLIICSILSALLISNFGNSEAAFTSPIFIFLTTIAIFTCFQLRAGAWLMGHRMLLTFCMIVVVSQLWTNLQFSPEDFVHSRSKGWGSGTLYALLAGFVIIYIMLEWPKGSQSRILLFTMLILAGWSIFLTQSRGVFLSLIVMAALQSAIKSKRYIAFASVSLAVAALLWLNIDTVSRIPIIERMQIYDARDLDAFTSGRLQTHVWIWNWLLREDELLSLLFGAQGLGGVKNLALRGLEFPHFDLLYLLYDGGVVAALGFVFFSCALIYKTAYSPGVVLFFVSGLHTNMVLAPNFLILAMAMHLFAEGPPGVRGAGRATTPSGRLDLRKRHRMER
ncbi:hypothetical protein GRI69_04400 [Erythrobacter vulgaris]|uniref:O-antigen ligase domain-containing protein n=1 Tax=Qipengyuania vulgaris TaxID=291985 RepID=A0A844XPT7_9SPHN|nr:hypothetical protein [Qipengyuania vulgaris]MXO47496.1 hypothetical protein [Qipengyuania vulgaris]